MVEKGEAIGKPPVITAGYPWEGDLHDKLDYLYGRIDNIDDEVEDVTDDVAVVWEDIWDAKSALQGMIETFLGDPSTVYGSKLGWVTDKFKGVTDLIDHEVIRRAEDNYSDIIKRFGSIKSIVWKTASDITSTVIPDVDQILSWTDGALRNPLLYPAGQLGWMYDHITDAVSDPTFCAESQLRWLRDHTDSVLGDPDRNTKSKLGWLKDRTLDVVSNPVLNPTSGLAWLGLRLATDHDEVVEKFAAQATDTEGWIRDLLTGVAARIGTGMTLALNAFVSEIKDEVDEFGTMLQTFKNVVVAPFNTLLSSATDDFTSSLTFESPPEEIQRSMTAFVSTLMKRIETDVDAAHRSPATFSELLLKGGALVGGILGANLALQGIGAAVDASHPVKHWQVRETLRDFADNLDFKLVVAPFFLMPFTTGILKPLQHFYNQKYVPEIPGAADLVHFAVREAILPERMYEALALQGFSQEWSKAYWDSHWIIPPPEQSIELVNRELITDSEFLALLTLNDVHPDYRDKVAQLRFIIPGVPDLVRMAVRESLPARAGESQADALTRWAKAHALDPSWSEAFWEAHWVLPGTSTLIDAFHRGIITEDELRRYIIIADYRPEPRPGQTKSDVDIVIGTTYEKIGRVDIRRAFDQGLVDAAGLKKRYLQLGYNDADADILTDISVAWVLVEEKTKVRNENLTYFVKGYLDREHAIIRLGELGLTRETSDLLITYAQERQSRETVEKKIDIYEKALAKDVIDIATFTSKINALGLQPWRVTLIINENLAKKGEPITI